MSKMERMPRLQMIALGMKQPDPFAHRDGPFRPAHPDPVISKAIDRMADPERFRNAEALDRDNRDLLNRLREAESIIAKYARLEAYWRERCVRLEV